MTRRAVGIIGVNPAISRGLNVLTTDNSPPVDIESFYSLDLGASEESVLMLK